MTCGLSGCGAQPQLPCGGWTLPGPGIEPMHPSLAGGFLTTGPLGKSLIYLFLVEVLFTILLVPGVGEGSGIPLQYSCLENPMDGGAW